MEAGQEGRGQVCRPTCRSWLVMEQEWPEEEEEGEGLVMGRRCLSQNPHMQQRGKVSSKCRITIQVFVNFFEETTVHTKYLLIFFEEATVHTKYLLIFFEEATVHTKYLLIFLKRQQYIPNIC